MAGTRDLGNGFETTESGLKLHKLLVKTEKISVAILATGTDYTVASILANAKIKRIIVVIPALTADTVTGVISITNSDGTTIYESAALGESDTHILSGIDVPLVGTNTILLTLNKAAGATATIYVTAYLEG